MSEDGGAPNGRGGVTNAGSSGRKKILVVDDVPMFRDLMSVFLSRSGRVLLARDGAEALAMARRDRPDLVISDLEMPGSNGEALCRAMREDPDLRGTPFLMFTPDGAAEDHVRAIRAGADDVLTKPIQRIELLQNVSRFLASPTVRGLPRVPVEAPVQIFLPKEMQKATALNLSRGGLFIHTDLKLPKRSEWRIRFQLPEIGTSLSPTAMVVWRADAEKPGGPGLGLRFVEIDGDDARAIDEFVYERTPFTPITPQTC